MKRVDKKCQTNFETLNFIIFFHLKNAVSICKSFFSGCSSTFNPFQIALALDLALLLLFKISYYTKYIFHDSAYRLQQPGKISFSALPIQCLRFFHIPIKP